MCKIPTIIVSDEQSTQEVLSYLIDGIDELEKIETNHDLLAISNKISEINDKVVAIVDLSINKNDKLDFISKLTKECPKCKVLALSDNPSVNLIIEIMRAGAKEFVPIPVLKNEFLESINKLISQFNDITRKNKCKIISVFSNKGGIGKTSLATNLAIELYKTTKENVALIDLNFQMGDITTFLDLRPSFNISYMLENIDKLNETFLLSTLERYKKTNVYVLADPPYFKQADEINPKQIAKLFNTLKETFSYIIVDAEASFDGKNIAALDNSDLIFLVSVANLPALRNTQRCLELFQKLGYDKEKVQVIINRYMENDVIQEADIKNLLSRDIYWKIPNNYFAIMSAINQGIPVGDLNPASNIAQSYKNLAQYISDNLYKIDLAEKFENIFNK